MPTNTFRAVSRRIGTEKSLKYIGTASVRLDHLDFPNAERPNQKNVERLVKLFRKLRGCSPGEKLNRIPAVISEAYLQDALTISNLSREALLSSNSDAAQLNFPSGFRLECLRGKDRVQAARETLCSPEPRWVVDLFAADISDETKRDLAEEYANEQRPDDGEFYYKIREYQGVFGQENPRLENLWKARLAATSISGDKKKSLDRLFEHQKFSVAFDAFRHLPALYGGFSISLASKMMSMHCQEELLHYLKHVKDFWYFVFDDNESVMRKLDRASVQALQLKAPGACGKQARQLQARIRSGDILGAFSEDERQKIFSNLQAATVDCSVPSLHSFFQDRKYLEDAAQCFKKLFNLGKKETIRAALENAYLDEDECSTTCLVQTSCSSFKSIVTNRADQFDVAYRQLWLYARRHFEDMPDEQRRIFAGPKAGEADEMVLFDFALLAHKLGFRGTGIKEVLEGDPDRQIARRLLMTARKPDQFNYDDIESKITAITQVIEAARPIPDGQAVVMDDYEVAAESRSPAKCGRPLVSDQMHDKPLMFLDKLHASTPSQSAKLSSFFIQRSIYFAYFGKNLSISCDAMQAAPEERGVHGRVTNVGSAEGEIYTCPSWAQTHMQVDGRAEDEYSAGRQNAEMKAADAEARLANLLAKERQQRDVVAGLESTIAAHVLESAAREKELQERLDGLRQREIDQTIRLETLATNEQEKQYHINGVEQFGGDVEGEIRLERIAFGQPIASAGEDADKIERLVQISIQLSERQNELNRLETIERDKLSVVRQLEEDERRLRSTVDVLTAKVGTLSAEEQVKVVSIAAIDEQQRSTIEKLTNKELNLRQTIDHLQICLERLEAKIRVATAEEQVLLPRMGQVEKGPGSGRAWAESDHAQSVQATKEPRSLAEGRPAATEQTVEADMQGKTDAGIGLGNMIRGAFNSDEEYPSQVEDVPLPLFSRSLQVASSEHSEIPAGGEMQKSAEVESNGVEKDKARIAFMTLDRGDWIVDREVVVDPAEPSEVQRLAIKPSYALACGGYLVWQMVSGVAGCWWMSAVVDIHQ
ncbi:hypothetical protein NQ176_g1164 [Zarea fungicola]|uniref:Uncharacterized protein n=1 Tax=Zarea fungicola TaxID=93591 RepID=A0ACC1NWT0_9HYPO|nr:hypothetical protein NQ176_g1164 [Lecanicillium fungicola]